MLMDLILFTTAEYVHALCLKLQSHENENESENKKIKRFP